MNVENRVICGGDYSLGDLRLRKDGTLAKKDQPWLTCPKCRELLGL